MGEEKKLKDIVDYFLSKDILVSEDLVKKLVGNNITYEDLSKNNISEEELLVINDDIYTGITENDVKNIDWFEFEKFKVMEEKGQNKETYQKFKDLLKEKILIDDNYGVTEKQEEKRINNLENNKLNSNVESKLEQTVKIEKEIISDKIINNKYVSEESIQTSENSPQEESLIKIIEEKKVKGFQATTKELEIEGSTKVLFSYVEKAKKRNVQDFVAYFRARFKQMEPMIRSRLKYPVVSLNKINTRSQNDKVSIVGMISNISITKNGHFMMTLEDLTGSIRVLIVKDKKRFNDETVNIFELAKELVVDEVIGMDGVYGKDIVFLDELYTADLPLIKELKKSPIEEYVVFLGDPHLGANEFLKEEFENMINWMCGEKIENRKILSSDQQETNMSFEEEQEMIKKIKYIIIAGDVVDGIGIYPGQEGDLEIKDVKVQFDHFVKYIKRLPKHIQIIVSGGNHEPMRIAEPQPPIYKEYAETLWEMPNVVIVSNPAIVNIGSTGDFEGFDCLIYHGYSFIYYADINERIRAAGGLKRADLIMELLLKKRHLAPAHGSTLYIPDNKKDNLVIDKVPDFFVTGHIHRLTAIPNHKGISLLNCSTWMGETDFQEKVGLKPQVAKLPIANLRTREIKIIDFELYN